MPLTPSHSTALSSPVSSSMQKWVRVPGFEDATYKSWPDGPAATARAPPIVLRTIFLGIVEV